MKATGKAPRSSAKTGDEKAGGGAPGWLLVLGLVLATAAAYSPVWRAGFIWDDDIYVTENPLLTAPDGLRRIWFSLESPSQYFPLTYTTFYLERLCWGLNPAGYHGINLLLHAANALLAWRLLARLRLPGAWLAAALFALHPVQVESVAWITERKNVLMGFFFLLSLLAWTRFVDETGRRRWRFYAAALGCYALALAAKTTACTLPAALLLVLWLKRMPIGWRRWAQAGPFVALGIGMGLMTMWWERFHQGTQGALFSIGPLERVLIASRALWFYAGKLLWPAHLTFSYPRWTISASDPATYVWLLAAAALGVVIWRGRRRLGRGVEVAALYFAATLSPVLGFIMLWTFLFSFVADHYQYLACLGPLALAAAGMERGLGRASGRIPLLKPAGCAALLAALGALTWFQCGQYANAETLWRATLARNPDSWLAHNDLGMVLTAQGKNDAAASQFKMALDLNPDYPEPHNNLALLLSQNGELAEAIAQFRKALDLRPSFPEARNGLGLALIQQGAVPEAIAEYRKALDLRPNFPEAHNNLGLALLQRGAVVEAIAEYRKALDLRPNFPEAHNNLANALIRQEKFAEAVAEYRKALDISPNLPQVRNNLGLALLQQGEAGEAIAQFQKSLEINPAQPQVQNKLALVLATAADASLRNGARAVALAEQANQLTEGGNPLFLYTLAAAYAEAGRYGEAAASARKALAAAEAQKDSALADALQKAIKLYDAGLPTRETK